jgi:hypothetical protein
VVVKPLEDIPYDDDVSDGNEDTWAAEIVSGQGSHMLRPGLLPAKAVGMA